MRRIITTVLATLAALGGVLGASAVPVSAANTANAANAANAASPSTLLLGLNGVSCVSAKFCAAVGSQGDSAHLSRGDVPLTMIWTGVRWRKTATPLPRGWTEGELDSVSCVSGRYCAAVGMYSRGSYEYPLAETWNGRTWTATRLPRAPGGPKLSGRRLLRTGARRGRGARGDPARHEVDAAGGAAERPGRIRRRGVLRLGRVLCRGW
jgi:hypothetical protein